MTFVVVAVLVAVILMVVATIILVEGDGRQDNWAVSLFLTAMVLLVIVGLFAGFVILTG